MRSPTDITFHCFGASRTPPAGIQRLTVMEVLELVRAEEGFRRGAPERGPEPGQAKETWVQYESDDGFPYWYNEATKESRWELPNASPAPSTPKPPASPVSPQVQSGNFQSPWQYFETDNGEPYWHNQATGESRWEDPNQPPASLPPAPTPPGGSSTPLGVFVASPPPGVPSPNKSWIQIGMPVTAKSRVPLSLCNSAGRPVVRRTRHDSCWRQLDCAVGGPDHRDRQRQEHRAGRLPAPGALDLPQSLLPAAGSSAPDCVSKLHGSSTGQNHQCWPVQRPGALALPQLQLHKPAGSDALFPLCRPEAQSRPRYASRIPAQATTA